MATTRKTNNRRSTSRKADDNIVSRTGRTIRDRPYASAAIATGAVTAVAAAAAGLFFFRRSDRSLGELTDDLTTKVKDGLSEAGDRIRSATGREPTADMSGKSQSEIAEEALTLKETGKKSTTPAEALADTPQ
jgi:hypothetical protein